MDLSVAYAGYTLHDEKVELHQEKGHHKRGKARCILRALNWFFFQRDGFTVYPDYEYCSPEFWKGVVVHGFAASLSGDARWHIMAGLWSYEFGEKEMALIRIENVVGLSKECHSAWRGGETALWLETKEGFAYALLDPADEYRRGWADVIQSWAEAGNGEAPVYRDVDLFDSRPRWWKGNKAWDYAYKEAVRAKDNGFVEIKRTKRTSPAPSRAIHYAPSPRPEVHFVDSDKNNEDSAPHDRKRKKRDSTPPVVTASSGDLLSPPVVRRTSRRKVVGGIAPSVPRKPLVLIGDSESEDESGEGPCAASSPATAESSTAKGEVSAVAAEGLSQDPILSSQESAGISSLKDAIDAMGVGLSQRPANIALLAGSGSKSRARSVPVVGCGRAVEQSGSNTLALKERAQPTSGQIGRALSAPPTPVPAPAPATPATPATAPTVAPTVAPATAPATAPAPAAVAAPAPAAVAAAVVATVAAPAPAPAAAPSPPKPAVLGTSTGTALPPARFHLITELESRSSGVSAA
ncbi:hypothetical protein V565_129920, partial [Rhizoctonia solani 123E]